MILKELIVVTFSDKPLDENNLLKKSCDDLGLNLEVLLHTPWTQNSIKLQLLYKFLNGGKQEQLLLVVDALDVILFDDAATISKSFDSFEVDILISAEANYMFKNPKLWLKYLRNYPKQPTVYNFLNSGSYIGSATSILTMLKTIQLDYGISLESANQLEAIKSDQYLLHRFFVDNHYKEKNKLKVALDSKQELLGCTGGRFCIKKFPDHSSTQAFLNFQIERNFVKLLKLHKYQSLSKDYGIQSGRFYNSKTGSTPSAMHLPGTWGNFGKMFADLLEGHSERHPWTIKKAIATLVSYFSYATSIVFSWAITPIRYLAKLTR